MRKTNVIGIMGAMPEEVGAVVDLLQDVTQESYGKREYYCGFHQGQKYVVVFSRWGKVAAATTATTLIHEFGVTELLFIGVAGAIHSSLKVGDVVIGNRLIQHDLDGQPMMSKFEIPLLNETYLSSSPHLLEKAKASVIRLLEDKRLHEIFTDDQLKAFDIAHPKMYVGDIGSGDQFISDSQNRDRIKNELPGVLCVEMEGAAVAQVCYEYDIPLVVIRTISDEANEDSDIDFMAFISEISSQYTVEIVKHLYLN